MTWGICGTFCEVLVVCLVSYLSLDLVNLAHVVLLEVKSVDLGEVQIIKVFNFLLKLLFGW